MAKTYPWSTSNPPDTGESPKLGAQRIRELALAVKEAFAVDHVTNTSPDSEDETGEHSKVTLQRYSGVPVAVTDKGFLFAATGESGTSELHYEDQSGNVTQITKSGKIYLNSAYATGLIAPKTVDGSDNSSISVAGGGSNAASRGATVSVFGNEHANYPGQIRLQPGYNTASGPSVASFIDATQHAIMNLADPEDGDDEDDIGVVAQQAVTVNYLRSKIGALTIDPVAFAGEYSVTLPNGLIFKWGTYTHNSDEKSVVFADTSEAFPTACMNLQLTPVDTIGTRYENVSIKTVSATGFTAIHVGSLSHTIHWFAIGY